MTNSTTIWHKRLERQGYHLLAFIILGLIQCLAINYVPAGSGKAWGMSTTEWVLFAWIFAGLFQGWIAFFWRMELHDGWISTRFGRNGFLILRIGYVILGFLRFVPLIPIALSTQHTLPISPPIAITLIIITAPPILWAIHSAVVHFGLTRASGADHFDPSYRTGPLEKQGIYRYIPNAMYSVAVLLLYHAGLFWYSGLALIVAAAHHAFVWVRYYCTEKPDMREIYGKSS